MAENAQWKSGRSGGLSFYGNKPAGYHCKSKREGDIKGLNDKGGERWEVKTKRKGEGEIRGGDGGGQHFILPVDSLRITANQHERSNLRFQTPDSKRKQQ